MHIANETFFSGQSVVNMGSLKSTKHWFMDKTNKIYAILNRNPNPIAQIDIAYYYDRKRYLHTSIDVIRLCSNSDVPYEK